MNKLYNVGIYTRLSTDDANNSQKKGYIHGDESASIENQKMLLSKFAMLNGWIETKVYTDDGFGGGNFNRPGFKQMVEDAKAGIINLILVKDLSRLGRDYIEVGRYTDMLFPSWGCRFVSLLDDLDTDKDNNDMMHFRSLMNDYHLKELSGKIKTVLYAKAKSGQFLSAYAPYGYRKSPEDKHRLVVDEYAAGIVRKIFDLRLQKIGYGKIAGILNADGILSPRGYWHEHYGKGECKHSKLWMYATVKDILHNEVFLGHLINNHTGSMSYKDKTMIRKPKAEWLRHENAHEAVVSQDVWDRAQEINRAATEGHKNSRKPKPTLFTQKLFCMDCKTPMGSTATVQHRKNGDIVRLPRYYCTKHMQSGRAVCSWHTIGEKSLKTVILDELKIQAQAITLDETAVMEQLKRQMALDNTDQQNLLRQEAKHLEQRITELNRITADLYQDKVIGKISESTFSVLMGKNEQERQSKQERHDEITSQLSVIQQKILSISKWAEVVCKHIHLEDLCRADIEELIDRIEIGESDYASGTRQQKIKIYWRFIGCVSK